MYIEIDQSYLFTISTSPLTRKLTCHKVTGAGGDWLAQAALECQQRNEAQDGSRGHFVKLNTKIIIETTLS